MDWIDRWCEAQEFGYCEDAEAEVKASLHAAHEDGCEYAEEGDDVKINWKRVWERFEDLRARSYVWEWDQHCKLIQRLVNAELRGKKKGAKRDRPRTRT